jgi:hypothetical protein
MDPNKYAKNADIRADTLLQTLMSVSSMLLMLLGLIGLGLELFKGDGWIGDGLGYLFQSTTTMMLIPVIIFALWLLNRWISTSNKGETKKSGNLPMYIMMLVGAYYLFRLVTTGGF